MKFKIAKAIIFRTIETKVGWNNNIFNRNWTWSGPYFQYFIQTKIIGMILQIFLSIYKFIYSLTQSRNSSKLLFKLYIGLLLNNNMGFLN